MSKFTPDPPESETDTDTDTALQDHLRFCALKIGNSPHTPSTMFVIAPGLDTETLLAHACESLASASVMASNFADTLEGSRRNTMLGIAQVIMLGELAVNRALDNIDPQQ